MKISMSIVYKVGNKSNKKDENPNHSNHRVDSQLLYLASKNERQPEHRKDKDDELLASKERVKNWFVWY